MSWWEWIIAVILFLFSLTAIVAIHEAGHLSMAKLFNVYCQEYSIGFGPAILKKRRKGGETYFSIRAIPFGGYVSMYGEEMQLEEGVVVPPERSIEGIKKWKKIIVVSAGVILNAVTALLLFFISNVAFPVIRTTSLAKVEATSMAYDLGIRDDDRLQIVYPQSKVKITNGETTIYRFETTNDAFFVVDTNVTYNEYHYVLAYYPVGTKHDNILSECLKLYVGASKEEVLADDDLKTMYGDWILEENAPEYYPNFKKDRFKFTDEKIGVKLRFKDANKDIKSYDIVLEASEGKIKDFGVSLKLKDEWLPFGDRIKNTFVDFGNGAIIVFKGVGSLFTSGIKNIGGVVAIFSQSAELVGNYAFSTYLWFWGIISINLAVFNLFPFPGLDGWQILVTSVEGLTKKKIPDKVKSIVSIVGLILLFALMAAIVVIDILRLTGVM